MSESLCSNPLSLCSFLHSVSDLSFLQTWLHSFPWSYCLRREGTILFWQMPSTKENLDLCAQKLSLLGEQVDRILRTTGSGSTPSAPPPSPASENEPLQLVVATHSQYTPSSSPSSMAAKMESKRAPGRCHECHGPLSGYHREHPHGVNVCQLEHYDLCEGNIAEGKNKSGHFWRGCPLDYVPPEVGSERRSQLDSEDQFRPNSGSSSSEESNHSNFIPSGQVSPASRAEVYTRSKGQDQVFSDGSTTHPQSKSTKDDSGEKVIPKSLSNTGEKCKEDLLLEAELAELEVLKEREKKMEIVRKARLEKQKVQDNLDRLARQERGEGAKSKHSLHERVDGFHANNYGNDQASRRPSIYTGPTMDTMRRDEYTKNRVEEEMDGVRDIPSFSNARPDLNHTRGVPRLKSSSLHQQVLTEDEPPRHRQTQPYSNSYGHHERCASPDRAQNLEALYKWATKYDRYGEPYRTLVEHVVPPISKQKTRTVVNTEPGWYYDEQSGRAYQTRTTSPRYGHLSQSQYQPLGGHTDRSAQARRGQELTRTPTIQRRNLVADDRFPGIVPLGARSVGDKEGKVPDFTDHAKNLPVEFAKSATAKNMNFALWVYAAASELHSSMIGITPPIERSVLEAKLQHIMNVVHVTCLNSTAAEYKPASWLVGRTYHSLVQAKVDSGREHWSDFEALYRGSPHASEMVSAEREHRAALTKQVVVGGKKDDQKSVKKRPCTSWNDSEVEGKCKYEAEHPGEKCNRQHSCNYCDKKGFSRNYHQERFCKRKAEGEK